jgi:hypothetical protein
MKNSDKIIEIKKSPEHYPAAMVNITNRCTLRCRHCFLYREKNPNRPDDEMDTATLSENAKTVTDNCPSKALVLPLYLAGDAFVNPYCCYGNDVDCDLCGAWVVFHLAAVMGT